MRGADALVETLSRNGIDIIFSLSGNQIMPIYDACIDAGIRIVHTRHEAACVFMADAWAQLTGKVGVALVTAGPGFGNALGALYSSRAAESPVLLLSGDSPVALRMRGAFQELDQVSASQAFTKHSLRVENTATIRAVVEMALQTARTGRPGPVHLALPFDIVQGDANSEAQFNSAGQPVAGLAPPAPQDIAAVTAALSAAASPVILLGPCLSETRAPGAADRLSMAMGAPVVVMESPRGLNDPALGRLSSALADADLIAAFGKRIDFTLGFGSVKSFSPNCRWIAVDAEDRELARAQLNLGDSLLRAVCADPREMIYELCKTSQTQSDRGGWIENVAELIRERSFSSAENAGTDVITPLSITRAVALAMSEAKEPVLICDGGEFGQWAQAALACTTRIINGPSGAIGGGLCYAMGARTARPDATVFALMGDGTIGFHLAEFETAVRENLPFVAIVGNDRRWNAEHQIQLREYGEDRLIGCALSGARYDLVVAALGGHGEHVTRVEDLRPALARAARSGLPACVNIEMEGLPAPVVASHG